MRSADTAERVEYEEVARARPRLTGPTGVLIVVAGAAIGALADALAGSGPGWILGLGLILGAAVAASLTRAGVVWVVIPVPPLVFIVMAVAAGVIDDHDAGVSVKGFVTSAATSIAKGFMAMATATVLAGLIAIIRIMTNRAR